MRVTVAACLLALAPTLLPHLRAQQGVSLEELAEIARKRHASQAAAMKEVMGQYLPDLETEYARNRVYLDRRFAEFAKLGDGLVSELLPRLVPAEEGDPVSRRVAENSARVLLLLGPDGFVDELIALLGKPSYTGRLRAIELLGHTRSRRAGQALAKALPTLRRDHLTSALDALLRLREPSAAGAVAAQLGSDQRRVRAAALRYVVAMRPPEARAAVIAALHRETDTRLVDDYLEYLVATSQGDAATADAVAGLLDDQDLDRGQRANVCRALATIAPKGHAPTIKACAAILEGETITGTLAIEAALTMRRLGDAKGVTLLLGRLKADIARDRKNAEPYIARADLLMSMERWQDAVGDYQNAIERTRNGDVLQHLYLQVARAESHRKRWGAVVRALRESGASFRTVRNEARLHPALGTALEQPSVQRYVEQLERRSNRGG